MVASSISAWIRASLIRATASEMFCGECFAITCMRKRAAPLPHGRILHEVAEQAEFGQAAADEARQPFGAHLHADDRRRIAVIVEAGSAQLAAQLQHVAHQLVAQDLAFRPSR